MCLSSSARVCVRTCACVCGNRSSNLQTGRMASRRAKASSQAQSWKDCSFHSFCIHVDQMTHFIHDTCSRVLHHTGRCTPTGCWGKCGSWRLSSLRSPSDFLRTFLYSHYRATVKSAAQTRHGARLPSKSKLCLSAVWPPLSSQLCRHAEVIHAKLFYSNPEETINEIYCLI